MKWIVALGVMLSILLCGQAFAATHTVSPGDTLWGIGSSYGVTVDELKRGNGLYSDTIFPGQKIYIPENGGQQAFSQPGPVEVSRGAGNISASEFDVLSRIVTAEADNQSYETKVAVAAVVLNRVKSPLFPKTIREVVYQVDEGGSYQFEPVLNGWINRPPSPSARQAALEALNGRDPSGGALFFWESWVKSGYLNNRSVSRVMDAFTFTY